MRELKTNDYKLLRQKLLYSHHKNKTCLPIKTLQPKIEISLSFRPNQTEFSVKRYSYVIDSKCLICEIVEFIVIEYKNQQQQIPKTKMIVYFLICQMEYSKHPCFLFKLNELYRLALTKEKLCLSSKLIRFLFTFLDCTFNLVIQYN